MKVLSLALLVAARVYAAEVIGPAVVCDNLEGDVLCRRLAPGEIYDFPSPHVRNPPSSGSIMLSEPFSISSGGMTALYGTGTPAPLIQFSPTIQLAPQQGDQ